MATEEARVAFHLLWSQAVALPGYSKADWKTVEEFLDPRKSFNSVLVLAFDRLIKQAAKGPSFDHARWRLLAAHFHLEKHLPESL